VSSPFFMPFSPRGETSTLLHRERPHPLVLVDPKGNRRSKIWDISPTLHCSIIGTCLSAAELRAFFVKLGDADSRTATDHALHSLGVRSAGQHDLVGKLLHKLLDNRHETAIKRFDKASTTAELRALWLTAFEQGAIPGAYWAVLTHPVTDRPLIEEVFGQIHMLSHMVGSANRVDITRLRNLERDLGERDDKIARQETRLAASAADRSELLRKVESLEAELRRRSTAEQAPGAANGADTAPLLHRLDSEKARAARLASRVTELEGELQAARKFAATLHKQNNALERELSALETALKLDDAETEKPDAVEPDLNGRTLLYVGGRPGLLDQLKALCLRRGGVLLSHDGGIEENPAALPGLVSRADAAFFPVDCISHAAAGQIKKVCREIGKPFVPLRTASVASFVAAIAAGELSQRS
jgi:Uncharacterized protein conserved in bacteria (DUF2325)